jgi:disulfide bond formation protein DsbB
MSGMTDEPARRSRLAAALLLLAAGGGLVAALVGQHLFAIEPCILCLYQRVPYAGAGAAALAALVLPMPTSVRTLLVGVCGMIFLSGAVLALYHVGVEEYWWAALPGCGGAPATGLGVEDLRAQLEKPSLKPCDDVDWRLLGVSLAGYNAVASAALAIACLFAVAWIRRGGVE